MPKVFPQEGQLTALAPGVMGMGEPQEGHGTVAGSVAGARGGWAGRAAEGAFTP